MSPEQHIFTTLASAAPMHHLAEAVPMEVCRKIFVCAKLIIILSWCLHDLGA